MQSIRLLPREEDLGGGTRVHRQRRADRDGVAQADGPLGGGDADAVLALAAEELGGLVRVVTQGAEHGVGRDEQLVLAGRCGELAESGSEDEATLHVPCDEAMVLEGDREAVCRGAGQARGGHELREGRWARLEGSEHDGGLVQNADSTTVVHEVILTSHVVRRKVSAGGDVRMSGATPCTICGTTHGRE